MVARIVGWALVAVVASGCVIVGAPGLFGWSMVNPLGQIVAFRGLQALAGLGGAVLLGLLALVWWGVGVVRSRPGACPSRCSHWRSCWRCSVEGTCR